LNPAWLVRNVTMSWRRRAGVPDFARRVLFTYAHRLPWLRKRDWTIGFRYPESVGNIRLLLRHHAGSDLFILSEVFEHEYYRLPLTRPPATILDLGANIGLTAIYFGRLFPRAELACVEPVPDNLRLLRRNLVLNSVRAKVVPAAVDVRDGLVTIELQTRNSEHKVVAAATQSARPTIEVAGMSVPTLLRQLAWDRIGLLKVDIEGHEAALLAADCDWLARVDAMCIECHDGFGDADLRILSKRFGFCEPQRLPGIWFMQRPASDAPTT
jgi:FkbM family methyltransferase